MSFHHFFPALCPMPERTLVDCDFPQELQVVGDREAHSCLASGICDDAKSYDDCQNLSARKHWSINSYSPASPRLSVVTGDRDPEGEALASMLKRTGRRDRDLLKLTWTKMSERKVQKSDHQPSPFLIELATQLNFFLARNKRFGGIGGHLIRTGLRMKQGSYVFSVWIFRMRKRAQRMSIFKRNSINSNVQQNLPIIYRERQTEVTSPLSG